MARIALNGRLLIAEKLEGIGWFTHECYQRMIAAHPEHEFLLLFDRRPDAIFHYGSNVRCERLFPPARRPWLYDLWFDYSVTRALRRWNADVFLSTDGMLSRNTTVPQVAVMHDLNFEHHPEWMPLNEATYYRSRFAGFAQMAARVATVSHYSKRDIVACYGVDQARVDVISNAPAPEYRPVHTEEKHAQRKRWTDGLPYFIFVGSLHPRKNIDGLLHAFEAYQDLGGTAHLLIVGAQMWKGSPVEPDYRVHFAGRLERNELALAMASAEALVFLPHFEGFGIPIVEAFAAGIPVVASNTTALPEVCGEAAAALVRPDDAAGAAYVMRRLELEPDFREAIVKKGLIRAADFSWDVSAEQLWTCLEMVLTGDDA